MTERGGGSCRGRRAPHEVGPGSWETRKAPAKRPVFFSCPFGKRTSHFLLPVKLFRTFLFKRPLNMLLTTTRGVGGEGHGTSPAPPRSALAQGSKPQERSPPPSLVPGLPLHTCTPRILEASRNTGQRRWGLEERKDPSMWVQKLEASLLSAPRGQGAQGTASEGPLRGQHPAHGSTRRVLKEGFGEDGSSLPAPRYLN